MTHTTDKKIQSQIHAIKQFIFDAKQKTIKVAGKQQPDISFISTDRFSSRFNVSTGDNEFIFKIASDSDQDGFKQIEYDFKVLERLHLAGITPGPELLIDQHSLFPDGVSMVSSMKGQPIDSSGDFTEVARLFATIHQHDRDAGPGVLTQDKKPHTALLNQSRSLLSPLMSSQVCPADHLFYFSDLLSWAEESSHKESMFAKDPFCSIFHGGASINKFCISIEKQVMQIADFETAGWGDPSHDVACFCSPITGLWHSNLKIQGRDKKQFLKEYLSYFTDTHFQNTFYDRLNLREPFIQLKDISGLAYIWYNQVLSADSKSDIHFRNRMNRVMDFSFIREIFDPVLAS